jgi:hypothetical protein
MKKVNLRMCPTAGEHEYWELWGSNFLIMAFNPLLSYEEAEAEGREIAELLGFDITEDDMHNTGNEPCLEVIYHNRR